VTNGNGNRRCDNLLATLPLFEIAIVFLRLDYVGSVPVLPHPVARSSPAYSPTSPVHRRVLVHLSRLEILLRLFVRIQRGSSHDLPIKRIRLIPL
jgi:hypothetical protein